VPNARPIAPDFELPDTQGNNVRLTTFRGKENVVLLFNRGFASPFCRARMAELRRDTKEFLVRHAAILIVAPDPPEMVREYWQQEDFPFPALLDTGHQVAARYHQYVDLYKKGRLPLTIIVGWDGRIRYRHEGTNEADIPCNSDLLEQLDLILHEPPA
jgi:peroxiredoxin Q/BCP